MLRRVVVSRRRVCQLAVLLLALDLGLSASARAQAQNGVITGTITDTQGGVLPGATLTVRNAESGVTRTALNEANGRYRVAALPPGRYNLTVELQGFATVEVKDITLTIGLEYPRDISMGLSTVQETVTVTGQAPVVETTKTEVGAVIRQEQIASLPF